MNDNGKAVKNKNKSRKRRRTNWAFSAIFRPKLVTLVVAPAPTTFT